MLKGKSQTKGFTLIECTIAMVLVVAGFSAIYSLLAFCVKTEIVSREMSLANSQARLKVEELKVAARTAGGSLTSDVANYFDSPNARYTRRWQISNDSMGSQTVTVLMVPKSPNLFLPEIRLVTRMK